MTINRRDFLKTGGAQAGLLLTAPGLFAEEVSAAPAIVGQRPDIVVVGAGAFGGWSSWYLRQMGANVTMVDMYGPGNSRSTSGDESRGVRSSYEDNHLWVLWAREAMVRWYRFNESWKRDLYFTTGDLIMRPTWDDHLKLTKESWDWYHIPHEVLNVDEVKKRWPQIRTEGLEFAIYEPDAGVARARRTCEVVAEMFQKDGGRIQIARVAMGTADGRRLNHVQLTPGGTLSADIYIFAVGPWLYKMFPALMRNKMRTPIGHVFYYGSPAGDFRFTYPNLPSWSFPGVTGWPALGADNRGFRVRTGGRPPTDPDFSERWIDMRYHEVARNVLRTRFPDLAQAPILQTHACHYESTANKNFIIAPHPDYDNVWITGAGNAEAFKFGPVLGEYIARRVLGKSTHPTVADAFKLSDETYDALTPETLRSWRQGIGEEMELELLL